MTKDLIPADDVLRIVTAGDGATIVAVHDRATRALTLICTHCGTPVTLLLSRGCTDEATNRHRDRFAADTDKHARIRHTKPRAATAEGPTP